MATVNDTDFSDIYIIPYGTAYIWGRKTPSGLVQVHPDDYDEFLQQVMNTYDGHNPSYQVKFKGDISLTLKMLSKKV